MDAHYEFLAFIEKLESMRKDKKLTPDVCAGQKGTISRTAQGGAGGPSITVSTQATPTTPDTTSTTAAATDTPTSS